MAKRGAQRGCETRVNLVVCLFGERGLLHSRNRRVKTVARRRSANKKPRPYRPGFWIALVIASPFALLVLGVASFAVGRFHQLFARTFFAIN